ncbi:hypothetical protein ACFTXJ_13060 [Streptomyces zhihengii]|uniref:hypothetical protein n=1 Tax=Streptomyces zhihengii TaxID=1818004 RepID=UPI003627C0D9
MAAPLLIVLARPLTLALRALPTGPRTTCPDGAGALPARGVAAQDRPRPQCWTSVACGSSIPPGCW